MPDPTTAPTPPHPRRRRRAFTLLELIVVVIILAVLASIAGVAYNRYVADAREAAARATLTQLGRVTLAQMARDDADLTRDLVGNVVAAHFPGGITTGWNAAGSSWELLKAADTVTGQRQLAVGFDTGAGTTISDVAGTRSAVIFDAGQGRPMALLLTQRGGMRVFLAADGDDTPTEVLGATTGTGTGGDSTGTDSGITDGNSSQFPTLTVVNDPDAVAATDNFDRAFGPLGTTSDGTQTWQQLLGTTSVSNTNRAYASHLSTTSPNRALAVLDAGSADMTATATLAFTNYPTSIAFRVADARNYWHARYNGSVVDVYKVVEGTETSVHRFGQVAGSGNTLPLRVTVQGDTVRVTSGSAVMGTQQLTDLNDGVFATATRAGLRNTHSSGSYWADDFTVAGNATTTPESVAPAWSTGTGQVHLTWAQRPDVDLAAFKVFRDGTQVGQVPANNTDTAFAFTDAAPTGVHAYSIVPVDAYGNESAPTATTTVQSVPAPVTVADNFDRAFGPLGTTSDGTQTWQQLLGTTSVSSAGQAYASDLSTTSPNHALAVLDAGSADMTATATLAFANYPTAIAFRVADARNYWFAKYNGSVVDVYKVVDGTSTYVDRFGSVSGSSNTLPMTVSVSGAALTVKSGDAVMGTREYVGLNDGVFASATRAGLRNTHSSGSYWADDFTLTGR